LKTAIGDILPRVDQMSAAEIRAELDFIDDLNRVIRDLDRIVMEIDKIPGESAEEVAVGLRVTRERVFRYAFPFIERRSVLEARRAGCSNCGCGHAAGAK